MLRLNASEDSLYIFDVGFVNEVCSELTATLLEFGGRLVEDAFTAAPEDANVIRSEVRGVEDPGAVLVGIVEADPFVDVKGHPANVPGSVG